MDTLSTIVTKFDNLHTDYMKLTSSFVPSSVPTTIYQNIATITSVLSAAESRQESLLNALSTIPESSSWNYVNDLVQNQATINFYSVLENIATETNTASRASLMTEAARASSVMKEIFDDHAFYKGHHPSVGGNAAILAINIVLFGLMATTSVFSRQWWFLVTWTCGLGLEIAGYIGRLMSSNDINNRPGYIMNSIALTIGPSFMMAGIYYIIAQLTVIYGEQYSLLKPMQYSLIFITADIFSIFLQGAGGGVATKAENNGGSTTGQDLLVAGIAIQVCTIGIFSIFWFILFYRVYKEYKHGNCDFNPDYQHIRDRKLLIPMICGVSICCVLIFVRCIYRLIELREGFESKLAYDEIYFMIFEGLLITLSSTIICILSPGLVYGRDAHIHIDKSWKNSFSFKNKKRYNEDCESKSDDYVSEYQLESLRNTL
ncbi:hypothetical protein CANINC_004504 [Pichia inconspicua]|uniref:Sphingoid long-chain base transporter RSB1 n=1 Tax=Pichia inconspicua TaxID=52247 RepID=A0A4T0WVG4_9ASCO|nr:hypothetical protein CANINC_004504 [[Candida] inconspicua]